MLENAMSCWMGVFFIRRDAVLPISWVSINLYSDLDSRVQDEARRAPRRSAVHRLSFFFSFSPAADRVLLAVLSSFFN